MRNHWLELGDYLTLMNELKINSSDLVSIVIPAYNHGKFLREAVQSVLVQNYHPIELIVLDDGSTDETADVLSEYSEFYWETQENMGQSKTLKKGWDIANGSVLGYLSADDVLKPGAVRIAMATLEENDKYVATYSDFDLIDVNSHYVKSIRLPSFNYEKMLSQISCPIGPGAFFRRSAYLKAGPWNPAYRQMPDFDFWLRIGLFGQMIHIPKTLSKYRVHQQSQTYAITTPDRADEPIDIVSSFLDLPDSKHTDAEVRIQALANAQLVSAQLHLRAGRISTALQRIHRALLYSSSAVFSARAFRLLFNALTNRTGHRLLWRLRATLSGARR
mgnify:CR=1 FL=1